MSKLLTLKKVCIFLATAIALSGNTKAQGVSKSVVIPVSALPATCKVGGPLYQKISATTGLYMCTATNTLTLVGPGAGPSGPGSSTDNAIVLWNGAGGNTLKNSLVIVDGTGLITVPTGKGVFVGTGGVLTWSAGIGPQFSDQSGAGNPLNINIQSLTGLHTWTAPNADTKLPIFAQFITFAGPTAARTITTVDADFTVARIDAAQTFAGTQTFSGAIVPSQTLGLTGTSTNNSANTGAFGEYVTGTTAANTTALTTGTSVNVGAGTNISLTAGDWDCTGVVNFTLAATTSVTNLSGGVSTTTGTLPAQDSYFDFETAANVMTNAKVAAYVCPTVRLSLSSTTSVFLVTQATFTVAANGAGGTIRCRRAR